MGKPELRTAYGNSPQQVGASDYFLEWKLQTLIGIRDILTESEKARNFPLPQGRE